MAPMQRAHFRTLLVASLSVAALCNVVASECPNPADVLSTTELLATGVSKQSLCPLIQRSVSSSVT